MTTWRVTPDATAFEDSGDEDGSRVVLVHGDDAREASEIRVVVDSAHGDGMARRLQQVADRSSQIARIGGRLGLDADALIAALEEVTEGLPPVIDGVAGSALSDETAAVFAEAGMSADQGRVRSTRAPARTAMEYAQLLAQSFTVAQAAQRLGVSDARIRQRLAERTLYGFRGRRGWHLPDFQFTPDGALPGLEQVVPALPVKLHPLSVAGFFRRPNPDLEGSDTPLSVADWLAGGGDPGPVVDLARDLFAGA